MLKNYRNLLKKNQTEDELMAGREQAVSKRVLIDWFQKQALGGDYYFTPDGIVKYRYESNEIDPSEHKYFRMVAGRERPLSFNSVKRDCASAIRSGVIKKLTQEQYYE